MSDRRPLAIVATGLVTSVGLDAASTCAAIRCGIDNFQETLFQDHDGEWLRAAEAPLPYHPSHREKLASLLCMAIVDAIGTADKARPLPLILVLSKPERPGRSIQLSRFLLDRVEGQFGAALAGRQETIERGKSGGAAALHLARQLLYESGHAQVLIASVDSLLCEASISALLADNRLITAGHSDGLLPGEAAAALLVARPSAKEHKQPLITGIGLSHDTATIDSGLPLRAEGLKNAIQSALADAQLAMNSVSFRISDVSGDHYGFRETCLALQRVLHAPTPELALWHPADCIGEVGAPAGLAALIIAQTAFAKGYAPGDIALCHTSDDAGDRAAVVVTNGTF